MPLFDCEVIPNYPGYKINKKGEVFKGVKIISQRRGTKGYLQVEVNIPHRTSAKVHRLLALTFLENPKNLPQVNHIDGDKTNNQLSNLEWCSAEENVIHSYKLGLASNKHERHPKTKFTQDDVDWIRDRRKAGAPLKVLADIFSVHVSTISKIATNVNWI